MSVDSVTCRDARDAMVLFLYEEASGPAAQAMRAHIGSCAGCADEWERLSSIAGTISRAEGGRPRPVLAGAYRRPADRPRHLGLVSLAAAVLFVAIIGVAALAPRWRRAATTSAPASAALSARGSTSATSVSAGGGAPAPLPASREGSRTAAAPRTPSPSRPSGARASNVT